VPVIRQANYSGISLARIRNVRLGRSAPVAAFGGRRLPDNARAPARTRLREITRFSFRSLPVTGSSGHRSDTRGATRARTSIDPNMVRSYSVLLGPKKFPSRLVLSKDLVRREFSIFRRTENPFEENHPEFVGGTKRSRLVETAEGGSRSFYARYLKTERRGEGSD